MSTFIWLFIIFLVVAGWIWRIRKPPRPKGGGAGDETVGGIDLPTWVAIEENLDDE